MVKWWLGGLPADLFACPIQTELSKVLSKVNTHKAIGAQSNRKSRCMVMSACQLLSTLNVMLCESLELHAQISMAFLFVFDTTLEDGNYFYFFMYTSIL